MAAGSTSGGNAMKYRVTIGKDSHSVTLPDQLPEGVPISLTFGGGSQKASWYRTHGVLSLKNTDGVETNIRLRNHQVVRFEGESDSKVSLEAWSQNIQSVSVQVAYDLPGLGHESRQTKTNQTIRSQMTGKTIKVLVAPGDMVKPGDALVIIEAMKMENKIFSSVAGKVLSVGVKAGDAVQTGKELLRIAL